MADESEQVVGRVLVVDDTEASRYAVARHLRHAGFSVDEADSGLEAIARVEEFLPRSRQTEDLRDGAASTTELAPGAPPRRVTEEF